MPVSIDIHENEFLEEIYQDGLEKGAAPFREILLDVLDQRFGTLSPDARQRIQTADLAMDPGLDAKTGDCHDARPDLSVTSGHRKREQIFLLLQHSDELTRRWGNLAAS